MCELVYYRRDLYKDKKLTQFDDTIVKAYSDKILQTSIIFVFAETVTAFVTMNDSSTSDEPHVILTTKPTLVKMSKTNSETGRETANFRIKCKRILCQNKTFHRGTH